MTFVVDIYGASGTHASDLMRRGVFEGMQVRAVDRDVTPEASLPDASVLVVPIAQAKQAVADILALRGPDHLIIDCSGVMRSANVAIPFGYDAVSQFHFLAGPQSAENLRVACVRGSVRNSVFDLMMINAEKIADARIIETTTEEHDVAMGMIQGLTHALALVLREAKKLPETMIASHTKTPSQTSADMIYFNSKTAPTINEFLASGQTLREAFDFHLGRLEAYLHSNDHSMDDFSTPFFRSLREAISDTPLGDLSLDDIREELEGILLTSSLDLAVRIQQTKEG